LQDNDNDLSRLHLSANVPGRVVVLAVFVLMVAAALSLLIAMLTTRSVYELPTQAPTPVPGRAKYALPAPTPPPLEELEILSFESAEDPNTFLAGPTNGAPAVPTFRLIVAADLPPNVVFDNSTINNTLKVLGQIVGATLVNNSIVWVSSGHALTTLAGSEPKNQLLAGPVSGGPGAALWRVLSDADIPTVLVGKTFDAADFFYCIFNESSFVSTTFNGLTLIGGTTLSGGTIVGGTFSAIVLSGNTTNSGNTILGGTLLSVSLLNVIIQGDANSSILYSLFNSSLFYANTWNGGVITGATLSGTTTLSGLAASSVLWTSGANALTTSASAQSAHLFYAGPSSGSTPAAPTWRAITSADLPAVISNITLNGTVTVTSLTVTSLSNNALVWTDGSHTLTTTGTAQSANTVYAGPSVPGPSSAPTFRSLVLTDLPTQTGSNNIVLSSGPTISGATLSGTTTLTGLGASSVLWASSSGPALTTTAAAQSANTFYAGPSSGSAAAPTWRSITSADLPPVISNITLNGTVTVTSLIDTGLSTNSMVWTNGFSTLTTSATAQSANRVFAGPVSGIPGTPLFRTLALADLPTQTGTVNIVLGTGPSISGATLSGTTTLSGLTSSSVLWTNGASALTTSAAAQSANAFYAGPSSGSAAAPTWRSITSADLPPVISNITLNGTVTVTSLTITGIASNALLWTDGSKTVTTTGAAQSANTVYAGPPSPAGEPAGPTFRPLLPGDLPTQTGSGNIVLSSGPSISGATLSGTTTLSGLSTNSVLWTSGASALTTSAAAQSANTFYAGPSSGSAAAPTWRPITSSDLSAIESNLTLNGSLTLASVVDTSLNNNALVWTDGAHTLTTTGAAQSANKVYAGPASSPSGSPTFRSLVLADLPSQTGSSGNIVLATGPTISGATIASPVTVAAVGTQQIAWTSSAKALQGGVAQTANTFYAGPASGSAGAPGWRALVSADLPASFSNSSITGNLNTTGMKDTGLSASSLVWTDGAHTLTSTGAAQSVNTVFAGPASGPAAAPTFRSLGLTDLPAQTGTGSIVLSTSPTLVTPALGTPSSGTLSSCTGYKSTNLAATLTSFTPTLGDGTHVATSNAGLTSGSYKNLSSNTVWFSSRFVWTSKGSCVATSGVQFNLPVAAACVTNLQWTLYVGFIGGVNNGVVNQTQAIIQPCTSFAPISRVATFGSTLISWSMLQNSGELQIGGMYGI
jgi:hypothetical protein